MKRVYSYLMVAVFMTAMFCGCNGEDTPEPLWEYPGPNPAITDGPSEAQKMCYHLYQKYDLHVYYNLSGDEALITEIGTAQRNMVENKNALPMQAADEATAEKFLKLLTHFYELLPQELVIQDLHKRHVLVKVNPANEYKTTDGFTYWMNTHAQDQQGIVYYGYLNSLDDDTGDKFDTNLKDWKWGICYQFFKGLAARSFKGVSVPAQFGLVSKGLYRSENKTGVDVCWTYSQSVGAYVYNRELGKKCGFIHPVGLLASSNYVEDDWGSLIAWVLTETKAERVGDLAAYERLQQKYDIVIEYFNDTLNIDLEDLATKWQAFTI